MKTSENNKSFSAVLPNLQVAWDSTSLGTLKECPRKYFYSIILGRVPKAENVHLRFGQLYHAALETYDHWRSRGETYESALRAALRYCLDNTVVRRNDGGFKPWFSDDPNKNRLTLVRTVAWYLKQFKDDSARTIQLANGKPAVELSFSFEIDMSFPTGESALLCGHLDRLVEFNGDIWVLDRKTSKHQVDQNFFEKFNPDNQMTTYTLASQVVYESPAKGVIIDGAQVGATFSRFRRGFTLRHKSELEEWLGETKYWISQAAFFAEVGFWPKNDKSCNNYGGCPYREVCAKAPGVRDTFISNAYQVRNWDPLQARGDI